MLNKASVYVLIFLVSLTSYAPVAHANRLTEGLSALWNRYNPLKKVEPIALPAKAPKAPVKPQEPHVSVAAATQVVKEASLKRTHGYVEDGLNNVTNDFLQNTYGRVRTNMNGESVSYGDAIGLDDAAEKLTLALSSQTVEGAVIDAAVGAGKTTSVYRLQELIQLGKVPKDLLHGQVISVNLSHATATDEAAFMAALDMIPVLRDAKGQAVKGPVILHLQRTEGLISRDGDQFSDDIDKLIMNAKRKFAGKREVKFIVEVNSDDLVKVQKKNPFLKANLSSIHLSHISDSKVIRVARQYARGIEKERGIYISDEMIRKAMDVARRFYADMAPPGIVVRILDKSAASKEMANANTSILTRHLQDKINDLEEKLVQAQSLSGREARRLKSVLPYEIKIVKQSIAKIEAANKAATDAQTEIAQLLKKYGIKDGSEISEARLKKIKMSPEDSQRYIALNREANTLSEHDIARFVNRERDVAIEDVLGRSKLTFDNIVDAMKKRVIGQDHAVERLAALAMRVVDRYRKAAGQPLGVVWLTGPPGSGKTSGAYAVADIAFKGKLVRVDMAEFKEAHAVSKITSTSPGYAGYGDGNTVLDRLIKECSDGCVLLLDEVEEAHRAAVEIWVSAMGDGILRSGEGKSVNFGKILIIATTNKVDNVPVNTSLEQMKILLGKAMGLAPKILNRIDDVIPYNSINAETSQHIFGKLIDDFNKDFLSKDMIRLKVYDGARAHMAKLFQEELKRAAGQLDKSARDINRIFERLIARSVNSMRSQGKYVTSQGRQVDSMDLQDGDLIVMRRVFNANKQPELIFEIVK
ncbi:MAG: AAA family ATPase [Bdellovibrionota bacterium]